MPRDRLAVAVLVPEPVATEVEGLRRACGDPALGRVPPHVTVVPPVNVAVARRGDALAVLRAAAGAVRPFTAVIGPPATFSPVTPTIHLAVADDPAVPGALAALARLRQRCLVEPLDRRIDHEFVPHVTLSQDATAGRITAALVALADYRSPVAVDRVHLLREERDAAGVRRWRPVADAPFAPVAVVGRGGFEVEVTVTRLVDPEAAALGAAALPSLLPLPDVEADRASVPAGAVPLVVTARHDGAVVGLVQGWARDGRSWADPPVLAHTDRWAREAVADHLLAAFASAAADLGCEPPGIGG